MQFTLGLKTIAVSPGHFSSTLFLKKSRPYLIRGHNTVLPSLSEESKPGSTHSNAYRRIGVNKRLTNMPFIFSAEEDLRISYKIFFHSFSVLLLSVRQK